MTRITLTRRHALGVLAAPALLAGRAARAAEAVKIGLIMTMSGPFASSGDMMSKAADLFMASKAPAILGGQKVELIKRDDGGPNPDVAKRLVQELVVRERVQYLGGLQWSPNANAIGGLLTQAKTPCVIMNAGTSSIVRLSPYFARTSHTIWQSSYVLGQWAARNKLRNVYTLVTDFTGGIDAEQAFATAFTAAGGTIAAGVRMPIQSPNFVPFLQRARDVRPDAVFVFHPGGAQTGPFLRAAAEVQLAQVGIKLIGTGDLTSDEELPGVGAVAAGVITAHHYSAAGDRPANREFLALWHGAYGAELRPNYMAVAVWDGLRVICTAIAATKGQADPAGAMAAIRTYRDDTSPRGPISIDPETRDIVQNEYIREVRMVDGQPWNIEFETIANVKDPWKLANPA
jgi:branched-chain amino acid transport system substrate-binding protein